MRPKYRYRYYVKYAWRRVKLQVNLTRLWLASRLLKLSFYVSEDLHIQYEKTIIENYERHTWKDEIQFPLVRR